MTAYSFSGGYIASLSNPQSFRMGMAGPMMDHRGRLWVCAGGNGTTGMVVKCIDQTGTVLQSYAQDALVGQACTYALANQASGASWQETGGSSTVDTGFKSIVVQSGSQSKLVCFFTKYNSAPIYFFFYFAVAVFDIAADGALSCSGMTWSSAFGTTANFLVDTNWLDLAGNKGFDADLVVMVGIGANSDQPRLLKFPSITAMAGQAYGLDQTQYTFTGVGDATGLGLSTSQNGVNAGGSVVPAGFCMPAAADATTVFMYLGKRCMAVSGVAWVATLAASYPNGVMTSFALPSGGHAPCTIPGTPAATASATLTPAVQTGAFSNGSPYNAFSDVQKNFDGSSGAAYQDYYARPAVLSNDGAGALLVGWYQPWFNDNSYTGAWTVKERLRLMRYSASTGVFTDAYILQGGTVPIASLGGGQGNSPNDTLDVVGWTAFIDGAGLKIWHLDSTSAISSAQWVTWLGSIGGLARQVTCHVRIGAARAA